MAETQGRPIERLARALDRLEHEGYEGYEDANADARKALAQVEAVVAALSEHDDEDCFCEGPVSGTPAQCASCNTHAALAPFGKEGAMSASYAEPPTKDERDAVMRQSQDAPTPPDAEPMTKETRDGMLAAIERLRDRKGNLSPEVIAIHLKQVHAQVEALEAERERLRESLGDLVGSNTIEHEPSDERLAELYGRSVRVIRKARLALEQPHD